VLCLGVEAQKMPQDFQSIVAWAKRNRVQNTLPVPKHDLIGQMFAHRHLSYQFQIKPAFHRMFTLRENMLFFTK